MSVFDDLTLKGKLFQTDAQNDKIYNVVSIRQFIFNKREREEREVGGRMGNDISFALLLLFSVCLGLVLER